MKSKILSALVAILLFSCNKKQIILTVENPLGIDRESELVELSLSDVKVNPFIIKDTEGQQVPYQVTYDGKVLLQAGTKGGESKTYVIEKGTPETFKALTYARFITERKDDFAWENDRVAFRLYGPALVATDGPSNGLDIWYKRTPNLIIDKWYKDDLAGVLSYHEDHGEGLDDYKVGRTLGAGAMAPYIDRKLVLNDNFVTQEILDNGPLRTTFKLTYKDLDINGERVSESRTISLDAGSQLSKVVQEFGTQKPIEVAAGVIKRPVDSQIDKKETYVVYEEPSTQKVNGVYIALVNPEGWKTITENTYTTQKGDKYSHILAVTDYKPNSPVTYYTGYGWNKFGFKDKAAFQAYLDNYVESLKAPLKVTLR